MKKIVLGMMALTLAFSSMAQTTDNKAGQQKEFRKDGKRGFDYDKLNLSEDQKKQIKTLNESFRQQMQDLNKQGSITVDEQKAKRQALVKEHREKVQAILTPDQRKQAEELKAEFKADKKDGAQFKGRGGRGERFEELAKELNLTPDQSAKVASLNATFRTNLKNLKDNTSLSQDDKREQMKNLFKKHRSDLESLLTSEQKEQLKNHSKTRPNRAVK